MRKQVLSLRCGSGFEVIFKMEKDVNDKSTLDKSQRLTSEPGKPQFSNELKEGLKKD